MKLTVKTLAGKQLPIEITDGMKVGEIKQVIEKDHNLEAAALKLIAYGKVLDNDEKTATDYSLKEGDFIVAMVQKKKPAPKPEEKKEEVKAEEPVAAQQPAQATAAASTGAQ